MQTILVVDDDSQINAMLTEALTQAGYAVINAYSGTEALLVLQQAPQPDLILLDLMLPGRSGEEVLAQLPPVPIIVVSAKTAVIDKVAMLTHGAVDYISKPFSIAELLARIQVQLRLAQQAAQPLAALTFAEIRLDPDQHSVTVAAHPVHLTPTEFALLKVLLRNPGQVLTKAVLLERISVDTLDGDEQSLRVHISNLRQKLRAVTGKDYIEAVWGIGFKLTDES